jgi:hypothetical protein
MVDLSVLVNNHHDYILGRRQLNNSCAALKAVTGARLCASGQAENPVVAAACTGSTPALVRAAITLVKSEDELLLDRVLWGRVNLRAAAKMARGAARLVDAYRSASEWDLIRAAKVVGSTFAIAAE